MITGEDVKEMQENLTQEEIDDIMLRVQMNTKKGVFDILNQYKDDSRKVVSEAMTYAASSAIEVGVTGLMMMCNGQRKAVVTLLEQLLDHVEQNVKEELNAKE